MQVMYISIKPQPSTTASRGGDVTDESGASGVNHCPSIRNKQVGSWGQPTSIITDNNVKKLETPHFPPWTAIVFDRQHWDDRVQWGFGEEVETGWVIVWSVQRDRVVKVR